MIVLGGAVIEENDCVMMPMIHDKRYTIYQVKNTTSTYYISFFIFTNTTYTYIRGNLPKQHLSGLHPRCVRSGKKEE